MGNVFVSNTAEHPVPVTGGGFVLPKFDYEVIAYVGLTNNIDTIIYKAGGASGTAVTTLTFAYLNSGIADDDKIVSITQT